MNIPALIQMLEGMPPKQLEALDRLQAYQPSGGRAFPDVDVSAAIRMAREIDAYKQDCRRALNNVKELPSVPASGQVLEFGL